MSQEAIWMWGGVIVAVIAAVGVVWSLGWDWWKVRGLRRAGKLRRCRKCLFDMSGVPGLVCPECGKKWKSERALRRVRRRWGVALLSLVMLTAAWPVSAWPLMRQEGVMGLPTWVLAAAIPTLDVSDPDMAQGGLRYRIYAAQETRLCSGEVGAVSEAVKIWSRRAAALCLDLKSSKETHATRVDISALVPDSAWRVDEVPHLDPDGKMRSYGGYAPWIRIYPEIKTDWTLKTWNIRQQHLAYVNCIDLIEQALPRSTEKQWFEINQTSRKLYYWGSKKSCRIIDAIAQESKRLQGDECGKVSSLRYSPGTLVEGVMVRVYELDAKSSGGLWQYIAYGPAMSAGRTGIFRSRRLFVIASEERQLQLEEGLKYYESKGTYPGAERPESQNR